MGVGVDAYKASHCRLELNCGVLQVVKLSQAPVTHANASGSPSINDLV